MSDSLRFRVPVPVEYPGSDGQPMGETPVHRDCIIDALGALREYFLERPEVYVGADMFVYYDERCTMSAAPSQVNPSGKSPKTAYPKAAVLTSSA